MTWFPAAWSPADESTYLVQGAHVARFGLRGLRELGARHVAQPHRHDQPSPLRIGWIALLAVVMRFAPRRHATVAAVSTAGHLACVGLAFALGGAWAALLVASSPLGVLLARRALGDTVAAAAALALVLAASNAPDVGVAVVAAAALLLKETNALALGAAAVVWGRFAPALGGAALAVGALVAVLGGQVASLARIAAGQGGTYYSREHQRGPPYRVLVDLALVSPGVLVAAILVTGRGDRHQVMTWAALALGAAAPLKNARLLLAAELGLRVALAELLPAWEVLGLLLVDVVVRRRLSGIYDPVTVELARAAARY